MPIYYEVRPAEGFTAVTWTGAITAADLHRSWSEILADPEVLALGRALTDLRTATLAFSGSDLEHAIQTVAVPVLTHHAWRSAIVVEAPVQYGMSRQYQVFAEQFGEDGIFFDVDAALQWLMEQP